MDNLDESENTAKISDSAYSNSCSNSQSRRSHSSKSTHSGSNSSGSSGYGGKPSTSGYSNNLNQTPEKRSKDKETKKKKVELEITEAESEPECRPVDQVLEFEETKEDLIDVDQTSPSAPMVVEKGAESMDISTSDRNSCKDEESELSPLTAINSIADCPAPTSTYYADSFSCVISMHDGVIMYTTSSLTTSLGYPKDMWVGRPFLDFVHPRDRNIFASQISTGLGAPRNVDGMEVKVISQGVSTTSIVCRIRRYRGLSTGFGVKERVVTFVPFLLKLSFKNMAESDSDAIYLVLQAALFQSAFKTPNEPVSKPIPFVIRHSAKGALEYIDPESVPYLGYMPQDLMSKDALQLYHPHDLDYLQDIYEIIVREGGVAKSDPYRLLAQNGDYVKLESEFSSFVNPWSKKVEFVIGKHYILQGPTNPDVFETVDANTLLKLNDEEISRARGIRENMYRILNNLLTKPAETAKQQMTKHCDELSAYLDTFPEDSHKHDDDLRIDVHDAGHNYYERDSVMLGGISPHNDYHDSKYGHDTPISYNQLNYNENLQRYFDSHQPYVFEDRNTVNRENVKDPKGTSGDSLYPYERYDFNEMGSLSKSDAMANSTSAPLVNSDYIPLKLTEALLSRHNAEMEYELVKLHRKNRSSSRGDRERNYETRRKKKEHLARCNASFYPTDAATLNSMLHTQGVKRPSKPTEPEPCSHKHHCPSHSNRRWTSNAAASNAPTATQAAPWSTTPVNNSFILGVDVPQVPMVSHVSPIPGMIPMYYAPPTPAPRHLHANHGHASIGPARYQSPTMPCMMYGHPVYGSPMLYSPIGPPVTYAMPHGFVPPNVPCGNTTNAVGLSTRNYQETCKKLPAKTCKHKLYSGGSSYDKNRASSYSSFSRSGRYRNCSTNTFRRESERKRNSRSGYRKTEISSDNRPTKRFCSKSARTSMANWIYERQRSRPRVGPIKATSTQVIGGYNKKSNVIPNRDRYADDVPYKTDGESSYSSFYSSFFKTDSGSTDDSDVRRAGSNDFYNSKSWAKKSHGDESSMSPADGGAVRYETQHVNEARRKVDPPWMQQVCVTSELVYKYQIVTKNLEETLSSDKKKMESIEQPSMVNDQLSQLYLDLQLQGVAARLTLEEGVTSSSSSGEETSSKTNNGKFSTRRRKREHSKLVMIYEEDAPLPPPSDDAASSPTF